jgi:hypothetical protein
VLSVCPFHVCSIALYFAAFRYSCLASKLPEGCWLNVQERGWDRVLETAVIVQAGCPVAEGEPFCLSRSVHIFPLGGTRLIFFFTKDFSFVSFRNRRSLP